MVQLRLDMALFKRLNPEATFATFLQWHSPRDIMQEGGGRLSVRMQREGNQWEQLWRHANGDYLAIIEQEAYLLLDWLDQLPVERVLEAWQSEMASKREAQRQAIQEMLLGPGDLNYGYPELWILALFSEGGRKAEGLRLLQEGVYTGEWQMVIREEARLTESTAEDCKVYWRGDVERQATVQTRPFH